MERKGEMTRGERGKEREKKKKKENKEAILWKSCRGLVFFFFLNPVPKPQLKMGVGSITTR